MNNRLYILRTHRIGMAASMRVKREKEAKWVRRGGCRPKPRFYDCDTIGARLASRNLRESKQSCQSRLCNCTATCQVEPLVQGGQLQRVKDRLLHAIRTLCSHQIALMPTKGKVCLFLIGANRKTALRQAQGERVRARVAGVGLFCPFIGSTVRPELVEGRPFLQR